MSGNVIDLAAEREKRSRAAQDQAARELGALIFAGAMLWIIARVKRASITIPNEAH